MLLFLFCLLFLLLPSVALLKHTTDYNNWKGYKPTAKFFHSYHYMAREKSLIINLAYTSELDNWLQLSCDAKSLEWIRFLGRFMLLLVLNVKFTVTELHKCNEQYEAVMKLILNRFTLTIEQGCSIIIIRPFSWTKISIMQ